MGGCVREKIISNIGLVVKRVSDAIFVLDWIGVRVDIRMVS